MAKKLRYNYTFTPGVSGSGTVVLDGYVERRRLLLITNITASNTVIYNFSDSNARLSNWSYSSTTDKSTFTLFFNTSSMSATDSLMIFTETDEVELTGSETLTDPTNKLRVTTPQSLIDTDFEYGQQTTKWEQVSLIGNRPGNFTFPQYVNGVIGAGRTLISVTQPSGSKQVSATVLPITATPAVGEQIQITDSYLTASNGTFYVEASNSVVGIFTFTSKAQNNLTGLTSISDPNRTGLLTGGYFSYSNIGFSTGLTLPPGSTSGIAVTVGFGTTSPHGLYLGNPITVVGSASTNLNGSFVVASVQNPFTFTYYVNKDNYPLGVTTATIGAVRVRPQSNYLHRPFDGGVLFSTNATSSYEQAVRQTRRYFRYQSGKGIQMSTGTIMNPALQIESMTATGTTIGSTINIQTKEQHNLQGIIPGTRVNITGATTSGYNGTYTISAVTGYNRFQVIATSVLGSTTAAGNYYISLATWVGAINRLGIFDFQNGMFWEYNGSELAAVRRNSTFQLSGRFSVTNGGYRVYATDANFPANIPNQLTPGDFVSIRGAAYRVVDVFANSSGTANGFSISPQYRGPTASYLTISKIINTRTTQADFNIDKLDGTGPSGYNLDVTKMQMFYIDYTWYGAGFVRWGVRGPRGNVIYCHKVQNNNVNTEAYMRSGNLPARYESSCFPPLTTTTNVGTGTAGGIASGDTYIGIGSTALFPTGGGTIRVANATTIEHMNYTGIAATGALIGLVRAQAGIVTGLISTCTAGSAAVSVAATANLQVGQRIIHPAFPETTYVASISGSGVAGIITASNSATSTITGLGVTFAPMGVTAAQGFAYDVNNPTTVELAWPTYAPGISHWGSSVIMDGRFDDDKSLIFTYGTQTAVSLTNGQSKALFSIRVAPSVDTGTASGFGQREVINRMQLTLRALDISTVGIQTANLLIRGYLNATPSSSTNWTNAVGNLDTPNSSLAQIADYTAGTTTLTGGEVIAGYWVAGTGSIDLSGVRDLGNSIQGGGGATSNTQIYPDGPDTLTIYATNLTPATVSSVSIYARLSWTEAQA
jgi:hypothetical protein